MNKRFLSYTLVLLMVLPAFTQETDNSKGFRPFVRLGSSLTYLRNNKDNSIHNEYSLNINAAFAFRYRWSIGGNVIPVWTRGDLSGKNHYIVAGIFGQYNIVNNSKARLYPEIGIYKGNYCTCGNLDPYFVPNLWYLPVGGGASFALRHRFYLETGLVYYRILNSIRGKYNFGQYIIGLEYHLGK